MRNPKPKVLFVIGLLILGSVIYFGSGPNALNSNKEDKNRQNTNTLIERPQTTVTPSASAPTQTDGANLFSPPSQTATANKVITANADIPTILFSGHVFLEANTDRTVNPSSYLFDFDSNRFSSEDIKANDISFGLTNSALPFLVVGPVNGATGIANDRGTQNNNTSFQDCLDLLPHYSKGGSPIPEKRAHYCWKTNQGRIVEFSVEDISENKGLYKVDLEYTVWDTNM